MAHHDASHDEIWDDSALVNSWNEAFEEYKKYHSLAAKGEKVPVAPDQPLANGDTRPKTTKSKPQDEHPPPDNRDEQYEPESEVSTGAQPAVAPGIAPVLPSIPQVLTGTVQDENLKNIMMSWYYAGYYTGLYEGKQQGYATARQEGG